VATPPQAIIFDIGRVIVRVNPRRVIEPLFAVVSSGRIAAGMPQLSPEKLWSAIEDDPSWATWQEGRLSPHEWHKHVTGLLGISIGLPEFCAAWNRALDPETILGDELFAKLSSHSRLALLSNTDPIHSEYLEKHFAFVRRFPVRVYSCDIGSRKPFPLIYQTTLRSLGVSARDALYIDDILEFAEAARYLGLDAIQFENPIQLINELSGRGFICQ
jgi:glucose-1-phosphatase